jgi:hypothetical protein
MKITKRRLQTQGLKVSHYPLRELRARAEAYLSDHREELIAEVKQTVERWRAEGFFGRERPISFMRKPDAKGEADSSSQRIIE